MQARHESKIGGILTNIQAAYHTICYCVDQHESAGKTGEQNFWNFNKHTSCLSYNLQLCTTKKQLAKATVFKP